MKRCWLCKHWIFHCNGKRRGSCLKRERGRKCKFEPSIVEWWNKPERWQKVSPPAVTPIISRKPAVRVFNRGVVFVR